MPIGAISWASGFSADYILAKVDPVTWADVEERRFTAGSIDRQASAELAESASLTITEKISTGEEWIRIYLQARQEWALERVPIFTGLTSMPERQLVGKRESYSVSCFSVLKPAKDIVLPRGFYAPAGSGAEFIAEMLSVSPCPIEVEEDSPVIAEAILAADGETRLGLARKVLDVIGWRILIKGDGTIKIGAYPSEAILDMGVLQNDIIEPSLTDLYDWYNCPNCLLVINGEKSAVARDDDAESTLSTVARGREIWACETSTKVEETDNLASYAIKKLKELQNARRAIKYTRRYYGGVDPGDIVKLEYMEQGIDGEYRIEKQTITLGYGCRIAEEVVKI